MSEQDIRDIKEIVTEIQAGIGDKGELRVALARVEEHVKSLPAIKKELLGHQRRLSRLEGVGTFAGLIVATVLGWVGLRR